MIKKTVITLFLALATVSNIHSFPIQEALIEEVASEQSVLIGSYEFQGDSYGDFRGDFVAVLSDGSQWKVHPDHPEKFRRWNVGDRIHVGVRTSWYWFKREHKFYLYNHDKGESVKVMVVSYGDEPLVVVDATTPTATDSFIVPIYGTDSNGNVYVIDYRQVPCSFRSDITLSDGSVWRIGKNFRSFKYGRKVYVGYNESEVAIEPFLISGVERGANWAWSL